MGFRHRHTHHTHLPVTPPALLPNRHLTVALYCSDQIKALRSDINSWVATYRREERVSGRPSYG